MVFKNITHYANSNSNEFPGISSYSSLFSAAAVAVSYELRVNAAGAIGVDRKTDVK